LPLVDIDVPSAVEVFTTLRYVNLYLLTYLLTQQYDPDEDCCNLYFALTDVDSC